MRPVFKSVYHTYRFFSFLRYWANRRFTRTGLAVLSAVALAAILGPDTDNNVAYQGFTLLFVLLVMAVCFSWFFRTRFTVTRLLPQFGTAGSPLIYTVLLRNLTSKTQTGLFLLENLADSRPSFQDWLAMQLADERQTPSFRISGARRNNPFKLVKLSEVQVPPALPDHELAVRCELLPVGRGMLRL